MNQKQQDSLARYLYDVSKGFILASVATVFLPHPAPPSLFALCILAGCGLFFTAYSLENN